ncbi:wee1-like protein kinase 2 [Sycon ciliatum]|uniref:wee1-like protein kinase 2 n=1 Tax=Sycon ciliatum TaxID=27933 RepID=UPI0031F6E53B
MGRKIEDSKDLCGSPGKEWTMDCYDQLRICLFSDAERESPSPSPPTTPEHLGQATKRRRRYYPSETIMPCTPAPPRSALRTTFIRTPANAISESAGRYHQEFEEMDHIGSGAFGSVYKCRNRVDNGTYAVKKSKCPIQDISEDVAALREARTHHQLSAHPHVVRYYSSWLENFHLFIQFEYCNSGSLQDAILADVKFQEPEVKQLMLQISRGLAHIHAHNLAHLDIKPGNIFLCRRPNGPLASPASKGESSHFKFPISPPYPSSPSPVTIVSPGCSCCSSSSEESLPANCICIEKCVYKIGDLGHAMRTDLSSEPAGVDDEGDVRYLAKEVLQDQCTDLTKADVFSLGLMAYEAAGGGPLPKEGDEWHALRNGQLLHLSHLSKSMHQLLVSMTQISSMLRPSATDLCQHSILTLALCRCQFCDRPPKRRHVGGRRSNRSFSH